MLFTSYEFIFFFLPLSLVVYFFLNRRKLTLAAKAWLTFSSLVFYCWWNVIYLPLILGSIIFNYAVGTALAKKAGADNEPEAKAPGTKPILIFGVAANLALLGYFKYADFFIANLNYLTQAQLNLLHIVLPLGISFFTFTQIAYLVDAYKGVAKEYDLLNYSLFVTFFPHLLAGPIIHHKEMMPQFNQMRNKVLNYRNFAIGIYLFAIGFAKKVAIADTFAVWANHGFDVAQNLTLLEAWATSLSYTLQLYFDFSGYTDMALGSAWMFNIKLPINFNSPYRALDIQDFWRRWHITLTRFLRDYIYIPLGGNRVSLPRNLENLMITFLLGGLWHGAGWTFIFWGFLHGAAMVLQRVWTRLNFRLPTLLAWFLTFNFVNFAWIFFRAKTWDDALKVVKGMVGLNGLVVSPNLAAKLAFLKPWGVQFGDWMGNLQGNIHTYWAIAIMLAVAIFWKNSNDMAKTFKPTWANALFVVAIVALSMLNAGQTREFLYFNF